MIKKVVLSSLLSLWMATAGAVTGVQAAAADAPNPDLSYLRKWEGQHPIRNPFEQDSDLKRDLWKDPVLERAIKKQMGKTSIEGIVRQWRNGYGVIPVQIENNVLIATVHQRHAAPDSRVVIMVDFETNKVFVCHGEIKEGKRGRPVHSAVGYTPQGPVPLEPGDCSWERPYVMFNKLMRQAF